MSAAPALYAYPLRDNAALYDAAQVETYLQTLFRNVDWEPGQVISLLGIGEKGTPREGVFRERKFIPPAFIGAAHDHLKRWAEWHAAGFVVPAVIAGEAVPANDVTLDKVAALTAIILDIDSGDTEMKKSFVMSALGPPSLTIASGGETDAGTPKMHLYWLLNEPSAEVERVAALRKTLAQKVGGDESFGRATQVIRLPGSVHAKHGKPTLCRILAKTDCEYSLDDLAETIDAMLPMPGLPAKVEPALPLTAGGIMDFTPRQDTAIAALHRDVHAGGDELTRWGEFSKVAGFHIAEVRAGRLTLPDAYAKTEGWMLAHMVPAWPQARCEQEFRGLIDVDVKRHGPLPVPNAAVQAQQQPAATAIEPTPATWPGRMSIPPRPWLCGHWLMRGKVTAVIAPGGVGKSSLIQALALSCASGRDILGKQIFGGPLTFWQWNLEDGPDDLTRQRIAASIHHGIGQRECDGRLYVDSGPGGAELCIAVEDRNGFTIIQPVIENVIAAIKRRNIDVLVIDPFVSSHKVNENDNNKIDAVAKAWARIAQLTGCAIVLVHHSVKLHGERVTADAARGAGALNNAARITLVLNRMAEDQAQMWDIEPDHARRYFSVQDDKHNLTPADRADWFQLVSVSLNNGDDIHPAGDSIGVVAPWQPPQVLEGVSLQDLFEIQRVLSSGTYFLNKTTNGKNLWAGDVVADIGKLDRDDDRIPERLKRWIKSGALKLTTDKNDQRRRKTTVTVGNWVHVEGITPPPQTKEPMDFNPVTTMGIDNA